MTDSDDSTAFSPPASALERAQAVSKALTDAARRARFSVRARGAYRGGSFEARAGAKFIRFVTITLFVMMVAVPDLVATVYFGLIASDQYVSEAKFTVSSAAIPKMDGLGSVTGVPPVLIVQDTQVVTNYIVSRAMVEQLERTVDLRGAYSSKSIDWWARFRKDRPIEKFTDYWEKMCNASISFPSGIVTLTVRAFTPGDAKRIAEKRYGLSAAAVEAARMMSERKMLYLHEIVAPALPQDAKYPKRWLSTAVTFLVSLVAWGATIGAMAFIRNHMA